jgi:hypothetical protein
VRPYRGYLGLKEEWGLGSRCSGDVQEPCRRSMQGISYAVVRAEGWGGKVREDMQDNEPEEHARRITCSSESRRMRLSRCWDVQGVCAPLMSPLGKGYIRRTL